MTLIISVRFNKFSYHKHVGCAKAPFRHHGTFSTVGTVLFDNV